MFYDYLKSIYNIVDKYDPCTDNFKQMLELNDYFIKNIGKKFDSYNKIRSNQNGGQKIRVISIASFNKIPIKSQDIQSKQNMFGGSPNDDIKNINKSILDMIDKLNAPVQKPLDLEELKQKIQKFKETMNKLIEYIELLHTASTGSDGMVKLSDQLKQIKDMLQKY